MSDAVDITTEAFPTLQALYPQLQLVHTRSLNHKEALRQIEKGSADMLVTTVPVTQSQLSCEELFQDPLLAAVSEDHAFRWCDSVSLQEFAEETFITTHIDSANRTIHEAIFEQAHIRPKRIYEVGDPESTCLAAAMGIGVALYPALLKNSLERKITRLHSVGNVYQERLFAQVVEQLEARGLLLKKGTIVDSTLISAPTSTKADIAAAERRGKV